MYAKISSTSHSPQNSPVKGVVEMDVLPLPTYSEDFTLVRVERHIPVPFPCILPIFEGLPEVLRNPLEN